MMTENATINERPGQQDAIVKPSLYQIWMESDDVFFRRVDEFGGWPHDAKFVTLRHSAERERPCYFGNQYRRDEWNTTLFSADDYYWWKMSAEAKAKRIDEARRLFAIEVSRLV